MEKINNFLNSIYSNSQSMMYFYLALSALAIFFIIIIIATLIKNSKETKKEKLAENQNKKIDNTKKEEIPVEIKKEEKTTEVEKTVEPEKVINNEVPEPIKEEVPVELSNNLDDTFFLEPKMPEQNEDNTIKELEKIENDNADLTTELPKIKTVDIDEYIFRRENEQKEVSKEKVEPTDNSVIVSNDTLKERLAKLNNNESNPSPKDDKLEDLMKSVGLEDTMVIPKLKDEKDILGK